MHYTSHYHSPIGDILIASNDKGLIGLWFEHQKYYTNGLNENHLEVENIYIQQAKEWLDLYFQGKIPHKEIPLHFIGTSFQKDVWHILCHIPYGQTMTYGDIAKIIAKRRGLKRMSSQAIGGAVGHNPIALIVPCHRVVGRDGKLTGYAGGIEKKEFLLNLENKGK